ncbi:MAG TPA: urea ABC transporter ATP-binding subunit UrtE [Candidatus Wunengus sp. YC63]|uniref:urea ABC transporter ATP-binding subunit UrtE n=1 Tax=Candidatus Wunengus sp. YC63 TaxID=3367699 RepID=UPI002713347E|nr:urea ABC transporter ATP-binding subunit UrtE [Candidatus Brocadiales bacterium]
MLKVDHLNIYYGESHVLHDVDIKVDPGQIVCLLGRNGVGKTTLLKGITGVLPSRAGKVYFDNQDVTALPPYQRAKLGIGFVPQGREIFPFLSVHENLLVGLEARKDNLLTVPNEIYELFPVLKSMLGRKGGDLSGGQQQQLAIGRALTMNPKLLVLDEPTEGIQPSIILEIESVIQRIKERGNIAILMVEQYLEFAWRVADYYYIMAKGSVVAKGPTQGTSIDLVKEHLTV